MRYPKVAQLKDPQALRDRLAELGLELPVDDAPLTAEDGSPLAEPAQVGSLRVGNRWCIHPMEGWDANADGSPSELTVRRWQHFGLSGAKLIWGGEAAAVRTDGRANPNQTLALRSNASGLQQLRTELIDAHRGAFGSTDGLVVGLQLTHSGRYCRPHEKQRPEPRIAYHHPLLDARLGIDPDDDRAVWTDEQLEALIEDYVRAASLAAELGFDFVDIKACHGYLLHEFLSAHTRPGRYGGDLPGRSQLLLEIIAAVQQDCPGLEIGVRLSLFDLIPFEQGDQAGQPVSWDSDQPYRFAFGVSREDPTKIDLDEPIWLIGALRDAGVRMVNLTCGSPYYNPHIQRPAIFPPSDGYAPPEDPLCGVVRQVQTVRAVKQHFPDLFLIGSGYTYLQDYVGHVAQATVRDGWVDAVGLGRMVLSYPELPADLMAGKTPQRKLICRTFSDCTTGPRLGLVSGCYPLDAFYKQRPERETLQQHKKQS